MKALATSALLIASFGAASAAPSAGQVACTLQQISDTTSGISFNVSVSADGTRVGFTSTGEPIAGGNPDGNGEIFLWDEAAGVTQITNTAAGGSFAPTLNAGGTVIAFISEEDLVPPGNGDGNREMFLWDSVTGFAQLTTSAAGAASGPSINAAGTRVAFSSTADLTGGNADGNSEVFLWDSGGGLTQITSTLSPPAGPLFSPFGSGRASLSDDGSRMVFSSAGDLAGNNADGSVELFLWQEGGGFTQLTDTADPFENVNASIDAAGTAACFQRGLNLPGNAELWLWNAGGLAQLTLSADGSSGPSSISADGTRVAFDFGGDLTGGNPDGNGEIFLYEGGSFRQITDTPGGGTGAPNINDDGTRIGFLATADLVAGGNGDGNQEIFLASCPDPPPETGIPCSYPWVVVLLVLLVLAAIVIWLAKR